MRCARRNDCAKVAQSVEHAPEKRGVASSILALGTTVKRGPIVSGPSLFLLAAQRAIEELDGSAPGRFGVFRMVMSQAALSGLAGVVKAMFGIVAMKLVWHACRL
jgi:hypothetical protein